MTYYIGLAVGLGDVKTTLARQKGKDASAAFVIAWADAYTDWNPKTGPYVGTAVRRRFHFRTSVGFVKAGASETKYIATTGARKRDPLLLGIGLHAYQDSWSHVGCEPFLGHGDRGHTPDDPSQNVDQAMKMAKATYDLLEEYRRTHYPTARPKAAWATIEPKIKRQFLLGKEEEKLLYPRQVEARVRRWKALLKDDYRVEDGFAYARKGDPWAADFEKAAATVTAPTKLVPDKK